jgi:hypothetical protein
LNISGLSLISIQMNKIHHKLILTASLAVIAGVAFYLLAASMTRGVTSDEQMYCTGGYLLGKGLMIYRDFSYVAQLPYHPLLCAAIYKITGTTHYLLAARLLSVFFDIGIVVCIFSIIRKIFYQYYFTGIIVGILSAAVFVFNPFVSYLLGLAWNHDMVLFCIIASFRIFMGMDENHKHARVRIFFIASLLTIAAWTRITSVFVMPIFLAMIIANTRLKYILPFLGGVIIFSIVPIWIMVISGKVFYINIISMPILNSALLHKLHIAYDKGYLTITALRNKEFLFLMLITIFFCGCVFALRKRIAFTQKSNALLAFILLIMSFVITYFPPTMWKQYFGIPVAFIIIVLGFALLYLRSQTNLYLFKICLCMFLVLTIATLISQNPILKISKFLSVENWGPMKVHSISKCIVSNAGKSKEILTLSPLYVIEGSGKIYTELSAGAFGFRVADSLTEAERVATHTAGVKEFSELVKENPPAAIIIGPELTRFEKIDLKKMVPSDWQRINCDKSVHAFGPIDTD